MNRDQVPDMNRESLLAVGAFFVVIGAFTTLALGGAVSDPGAPETAADVEHTGHVSLSEITISADDVTGGTATLAVDTYLVHRGDPVTNVTVVHRATDTKTGLVESTTERSVETLADDAEAVVSGTVTVPRESSYEIETFVYRDGQRVESASHTVNGVGALTPAYADTDVEFHRFGDDGGTLADVPATGYSIASSTNDTATLAVESHLTNTGDDPESGLELEVNARQSGSNVVADSATVDLSTIEPGTTASPTVSLEVPQGYDYYLDAVLWRDGTIVGTNRAVANLGPGSLSVDESSSSDGIEVSDFSGGSASESESSSDASDHGDDGMASNGDGTPGFGVAAAAIALLATIALARRFQ